MNTSSIGFVKLHRQFLNWEWYDDINTKVLFLHLLLKANFKDKNWQGIEIKRGQLLTSVDHLSLETGLSIKQIRTALSKLIKTREAGKQTTSRYTLITLINYNQYQEKGKQRANERQTKGKQRATTKEVLTEQEREEYTNKIKKFNLEYPNIQSLKNPITDEDLKYLQENFPPDILEEKLEAMENTNGLKKKYTSARRTLMNWLLMNGWKPQDKVRAMNRTQLKHYLTKASPRAKDIANSINPNSNA